MEELGSMLQFRWGARRRIEPALLYASEMRDRLEVEGRIMGVLGVDESCGGDAW